MNQTSLSPNELRNFTAIFGIYKSIFTVDPSQFISGQKQLELPHLPDNILKSLLNRALEAFSNEPVLLRLKSPITIIGDLHGHICDLFRIFNKFPLPPLNNFLFLGDIVDRGEFSIETLTVVYLLKILFPENVYVIRGNHEFSELYANSSFGSEVQSIYDSIPLNALFSKVFSMMPFSAILDDQYFCVHGGIGPDIFTLHNIEKIERPVYQFHGSLVVSALVWSDPVKDLACPYLPSKRGYGFEYGQLAVNAFLKEAGLKKIIRAHQCINGGIESLFDDRVITVFSASNYCGETFNRSGVLNVSPNGELEPVFFEPLEGYLKRSMAVFIKSISQDEFLVESKIPKLVPLNLSSRPGKRRKSIQHTASLQSVPTYLSPVEKFTGRRSFAPPFLNSKPSKKTGIPKVSTTTVGLVLDPSVPLVYKKST